MHNWLSLSCEIQTEIAYLALSLFSENEVPEPLSSRGEIP